MGCSREAKDCEQGRTVSLLGAPAFWVMRGTTELQGSGPCSHEAVVPAHMRQLHLYCLEGSQAAMSRILC